MLSEILHTVQRDKFRLYHRIGSEVIGVWGDFGVFVDVAKRVVIFTRGRDIAVFVGDTVFVNYVAVKNLPSELKPENLFLTILFWSYYGRASD